MQYLYEIISRIMAIESRKSFLKFYPLKGALIRGRDIHDNITVA